MSEITIKEAFTIKDIIQKKLANTVNLINKNATISYRIDTSDESITDKNKEKAVQDKKQWGELYADYILLRDDLLELQSLMNYSNSVTFISIGELRLSIIDAINSNKFFKDFSFGEINLYERLKMIDKSSESVLTAGIIKRTEEDFNRLEVEENLNELSKLSESISLAIDKSNGLTLIKFDNSLSYLDI